MERKLACTDTSTTIIIITTLLHPSGSQRDTIMFTMKSLICDSQPEPRPRVTTSMEASRRLKNGSGI
jgi:hypothetical protein